MSPGISLTPVHPTCPKPPSSQRNTRQTTPPMSPGITLTCPHHLPSSESDNRQTNSTDVTWHKSGTCPPLFSSQRDTGQTPPMSPGISLAPVHPIFHHRETTGKQTPSMSPGISLTPVQPISHHGETPVLPIEILSKGHNDPLSKKLRVKWPKLGVTTLN